MEDIIRTDYDLQQGDRYRQLPKGDSSPTDPKWDAYDKQLKAKKREKKTVVPATIKSTQKEPSPLCTLTPQHEAAVRAINGYYVEGVAEGHRHKTFISETAPWVLMITDNNPTKAQQLAEQYIDWVKQWTDRTPDELRNVLQTVSQRPLLRKLPKRLTDLMNETSAQVATQMAGSAVIDPMSCLPIEQWCDRLEAFFPYYLGLREALEPHERPLWPWLFFVAGGMMGTDMDLCYYYFYADPSERHRLNYIIWGVGDPTSGKHALQRLADHLLVPVIEEGKLADKSTNIWKESTDAKGSNKEKDLRPPLYNRFFESDRASNSEFIRSMVYSKEVVDGEETGRHMVTVDPEKDLTISKSGSWANRESMLLRSFHGEYDSQHYSNKQSVSARFKVLWCCFETFTPPTLAKLVNERTINSGLDTRTATLPTGKLSFKMMQLPSDEEKKKIAAYNTTLREIAYKLDQRRGELPIWPLVEHAHKWCDERRAIAEFNNDPADWLLIKRVPHWGVRVSAPWVDLRHSEEREQTGTYVIDETDLALEDLVLDIQYRTQIFWYYELHRQYYENQHRDTSKQRRRTTKFQECFRLLPEEFDTEKFAQVFGYANNRAGQKTLQRLEADKAIKRTMRGHYKKLVSELPTI